LAVAWFAKYTFVPPQDAVDIASLDILRGKSWDEIETDMKVGAVGGATLRLGADGLSKFLSQSKYDSIISTIEKSIGKLSKEEESIVKSSIDEGNSIDTVVNKINDSRESKSTELSPEVKSTPEDPLLQEARKYGSAEEFVKAQQAKRAGIVDADEQGAGNFAVVQQTSGIAVFDNRRQELADVAVARLGLAKERDQAAALVVLQGGAH
jgi:hypothetical protein